MAKSQILIIYSNLDNKPATDSKTGWVSTFSYNLVRLLNRLEGDQYVVTHLTEYDIDPESYPTEPAVIIPILSKNYFKSPLLSGYLEVFEKDVQKRTGKKNSAHFEFIGLFKNRVEENNLSGFINRHSKKYFYKVDAVTDFVTEMNFEDDAQKDTDYWMKIYDIAQIIRNFRQKLTSPVKKVEELVDEMKPGGIYLARVGIDLEMARENILRELVRNNYKILQLENLEKNYDDLDEEINEKLNKCHISIHLVGVDPGKLIKDRGLTIVEIENQLASQHSKLINDQPRIKYLERFTRVIWISPERENVSVRQKLYIENLKKDLVNIQNAEVLEIPIEELKGFVNALVSGRVAAWEKSAVVTNGRRKSIYFICEEQQRKHCAPIGKLLESQGYSVVFSNFEGELLTIRDQHLKNLNECDGTIIYYGNNNQNWVKSKLIDSVKALGMGRMKGINPTAIIVDSEKQIDLELYFDSDKLMYLKNEKVSKETFKPFFSKLENE
ncbi:MAG: hypothetical protein KFF73_01475 [Cyclobacteriaceae bacterium]|nr:hypothetical protein [Cyclobacteriaceae bacterium]